MAQPPQVDLKVDLIVPFMDIAISSLVIGQNEMLLISCPSASYDPTPPKLRDHARRGYMWHNEGAVSGGYDSGSPMS